MMRMLCVWLHTDLVKNKKTQVRMGKKSSFAELFYGFGQKGLYR